MMNCERAREIIRKKLWNKHYETALKTPEKLWLTTLWSAEFLSRIADTVKKFCGKGEPGAILTSY